MDAKRTPGEADRQDAQLPHLRPGGDLPDRLGPHGADAVKEAHDGFPAAQIRFTAKSDDVVAIAEDPGSFAKAWLSGRLRVEGNFFDLLHLRRLL